jgi:hypothetical protein
MSEHDIGYLTHRDRTEDVTAGDPVATVKSLRRAIEPDRLEQLPWPRNLFGDPASIAELLAETMRLSDQFGDNPGETRRCECGRKHKRNVSRTSRNPYGRGFGIIWFWSDACKTRWNQARTRKQSNA